MARDTPALTRHVERLWPDLESLFEAGELANAVQASQGWGLVQAVLDAEIDAINAGLDSPTPLEQAEYALRHGQLRGLKAAQGAADAIVRFAKRRHDEQQAKHEGPAESGPER